MPSQSPAAAPVIVDGRRDDLDRVMPIMAAAFDPRRGEAWTRDQCAATFALPGYRWAIALVDDRPVGFLLARTVARESELMLIAVAPDRRAAGIGSALIERWLSDCRAARVGRLHLEVRDGNSAAALYRRYDFREAGRRRGYYSGIGGEAADALTMVLALD